MRYWLVMPAAGAGRRFGADTPKQYAPLEGRTVIEWALAPFLGTRAARASWWRLPQRMSTGRACRCARAALSVRGRC